MIEKKDKIINIFHFIILGIFLFTVLLFDIFNVMLYYERWLERGMPPKYELNIERIKYSVLKESKQIFVSKYKTILPTEEELARMIEKENRKLLAVT